MGVPFGAWCRSGTVGTHVGCGSTGLSRPRLLAVLIVLTVIGAVTAAHEPEQHGVDDLLGGQHPAVRDAGMAAGAGEQPDAVDDAGAGDDELVLVVDEQLVDRLEQRLVGGLVLLVVGV